MKKVLLVPVILSMVFVALSCASKPETLQEDPQEEVQEDVGAAFKRVYNTYRSDIILEGARTYTVVKGDFLAAIARKFYGGNNGYYFPLIVLASGEVIFDPELLEPGMQLTIPDLEKNLGDPAARGKIKSFFLDFAKVYEQKTNAITDEEKATPRGRTRYNEDNRTRERLIEISDSL